MVFDVQVRLVASVFVLFLLVLTAGCRQIQPPATGAAPPWETPVPTVTPHPAGHVRVLGPWQDESADAFRTVLETFKQESGIDVEYVSNAEVADGLLAEIEAGTPPDVVILPKPNWLLELASAGAIPPLDTETASTVRTHYADAWITLATYDGDLYGVPFRANSKSLLWYHPDLLVDASPETPADLERVAGDIAGRGDVVPFSVSGAEGWRWPLTDWFENILLAQAGRETYEALARHDIAWTDPAVRRAAEQYVSLLRTEWLLGGLEGMQQFGLAESFTEAFDATPPHAAMWLAQGSVYNALSGNVAGLTPHEDIEVTFFPSDGAVVGTADVAVPLNIRPETTALLTFLALPEAAQPWIAAGGFISPNQDVPLQEYADDFARQEAIQLTEARVFAYDLSDRLPEILNQALQDALLDMMRHPDDIDRILAEIDDVARREQGFR